MSSISMYAWTSGMAAMLRRVPWVDAEPVRVRGRRGALHRLEDAFYASVLRDPLLQPLFGAGRPEHVDHLTAFTAESFGGPDRFTRELGFAHLIAVHRGLRISEPQRARFVELYMPGADTAGMPGDPDFRAASRARRVRVARRDAELARGHGHRAAPAPRGPALDLAGDDDAS